MKSYSFERISEKHLEDIRFLYSAVFENPLPGKDLENLFDTSSFGVYTIGFIAYDGNRFPSAYYGVFPIQLTTGKETFLGAQSGATMTHPEHQKKGLFIQLARLTYEAAKAEGIAFIFGFPNNNSLPGFANKLQWKFNGEMSKFTLKNSTLPVCEIASKWKWIYPLYSTLIRPRVQKFLIPKTEFNSASPDDGIHILKDTKFLQYKQRISDIEIIRKNEFVMLIKRSPHLMIGDVEFFGEERDEAFFQTISELGRQVLASKTILQFSPGHWMVPRLSKFIQPQSSLPVGYLSLSEKYDLRTLKFSLSDFDTF